MDIKPFVSYTPENDFQYACIKQSTKISDIF